MITADVNVLVQAGAIGDRQGQPRRGDGRLDAPGLVDGVAFELVEPVVTSRGA